MHSLTNCFSLQRNVQGYISEGRLRSSWTHIIPSRSFVEVRWRSLFQSNSLGKMEWDLDCMADVLMGFHRSNFSKPNTEYNSDLDPYDFWAFPTMKKELRGKKFRSDQRSTARFDKWVECRKKCIACQGRYFEKETVTAPPKSSDSE
jgi:hypothetical protein